MTYTFVRIKVHPKCDLTGWYLAIPASAIDLQMNMHKSATWAMFHKFFMNPHVFDQQGMPKHEGYEHYHPVKLAAGWITTALRGLAAHGVVYMNRDHGLLFGENVEILESRESEALEFPVLDTIDGIKITISRWASGEHYYLTASNSQVFSQPKFDSYDEAVAEARKYAHEMNITFKPADHLYIREGD